MIRGLKASSDQFPSFSQRGFNLRPDDKGTERIKWTEVKYPAISGFNLRPDDKGTESGVTITYTYDATGVST